MRKWKCTVCGYVHDGDEPPEKCPVCGADKEKFVAYSGDESSLSGQSESNTGMMSRLTAVVMDKHIHPIAVHTPNGIIPIAIFFLVLGVVFRSTSMIDAAYYNLLAVLLAMPVVLGSGYLTWKHKYKGEKTLLFTVKIAVSCLATIILFGLVVWKTVRPDVLAAGSSDRYLFLGWSLLLLVAVGIVGHLGGKLVFGKGK